MGSRKNYKASVEVGWSVPLDFFLCVFVSTSYFLTHRVDRALVPSLVTVAPVWLSVTGVFVCSHSKRRSSKALTTPVDRWHVLFHTKTGSEKSLSTGPQSESENLPGSFDWQGVSFSCSCVKSEGLTSLNVGTVCLKQEVADLDPLAEVLALERSILL